MKFEEALCICKCQVPLRCSIVCRLKTIVYQMDIHKAIQTANELIIAPKTMLLARISLEESFLTEDTDAGQLVLSSCSSLLLSCDTKCDRPKVFEVEMRKKGKDFVCIQLSETCVQELNLTDGCKKEAKIQFQMDRSFFSMMHEAVDAVEDANNIQMLFPSSTADTQHLPGQYKFRYLSVPNTWL